MSVVPSEHAPHAACWMAFPYLEDEWPNLAGAQREHLALVRAIAESEPVELLWRAPSEPPALPNVRIHRLPYGDGWTRDTAPVFALDGAELVAHVFRFNGWGGKFDMPGDREVGLAVAKAAGARIVQHDFVAEGGAFEFDGEGTLLTTPCLMLPTRTDAPDAVPAALKAALGVEAVLVVEAQLAADHTDGHIDTLARFVRPGEVLCMRAEAGDPNGAMLLALEEQLRALVDARGRSLKVHTIPSPGAVLRQGELVAASYCNYYVAGPQILVPTYGSAHDDAAVSAIAALFPEHRVRGLSARHLIEGGGAFHCLTQQQPA